MCMKVDCPACARPTWKGCGQHIDSALSGVPEGDRCSGWKEGKCLATKEKAAAPTEHKNEAPTPSVA